jgi:hypothetical protein
MTLEQQCFWDILQADPRRLAHVFGQELKTIKNKQRFNRRADECLDFIMSNFDSEGAIRTVKTWLSVYQLPIDPGALESFDKFHTNYGHIVTQNHCTIKSYERLNI